MDSVTYTNLFEDVCVLIPAFNPDETLLNLLDSLVNSGFRKIVVVNDGSDPKSSAIFGQIKKQGWYHLLTHAVNLGKGRALKTGLNYCLVNFPVSTGVITVDADGQHLLRDILKVASSLEQNKEAVVLGSRIFGKSTPLRSLIGNVITRIVLSFLVGTRISDTQTGLRGIPMKYIPLFLGLDGERYEFETTMLLAAGAHGIRIKEEAISAVYIEGNQSSHFNPLSDSMKIYFLLLRFSFSSVFASSVDLLTFTLSYSFLVRDIFFSLVMGRVVASAVNFMINRRLVFHNNDLVLTTIGKYYLLTAGIMILAYTMIEAMVSRLGMNVLLAKALAEGLLFIASFSIQRNFIFPSSQKT